MFSMRYADTASAGFCQMLDRHIGAEEYERKVHDRRYYVIHDGAEQVGVLRYNLFWDSIPFMTLLFIDKAHWGKGLGGCAVRQWEEEMRGAGYDIVMTSTQVDETAQHFYRRLGYRDCGCLVMDIPSHTQPMEMFMVKSLHECVV